MRLLRAIALAAALCLPGGLRAGEEGAPLLQVHDLQEDIDTFTPAAQVGELADGRLLVVTIGAIAVFDGVRWFDARHPRALTGMLRAGLAPDGRVHAAFNGDFGYFEERARGRFEWHSQADHLPEGTDLSGVVVNVVVDAARAEQWFVTRSALTRVLADGRVERLPATNPWGSAFRVGDEIWLQALDGHFHRQPLGAAPAPSAFADFDAALAGGPGGSASVVRSIVAAAEPGEWRILVGDARLMRWRAGRFEAWDSPATAKLRGLQPVTMERLRNGDYLIAGVFHGPLLIAADGSIRREFGAADGIPIRATFGLHEDRQGGVWLAQALTLVRIDLASGLSVLGEAQGLPSGARSSARWDGDLYVAGGYGLYRLQAGEGATSAHFERVLPETLTTVTDVLDAGERLLVARNGLDELRRVNGELRHRKLLNLPQAHDLAASMRVPGRYWLAHQLGVHQIDADGGDEVRVTPLPGVDFAVARIVEDGDGSLWLANQGGGLWRYRGAGDLRAFGPGDGVPPSSVKPVEGRAGTWFVTLEGVMVARGERLVSPPELPPEFRSGRVFSAYEDAQGNLWARGDGLDAVAWRRADGYQHDDSVLRAVGNRPTVYGFQREGDVLWVLRARDLLRIDLRARRPPPPPSPPLLASASSAGQWFDPAGLDPLPAPLRDLSLEFGSPDLHRSDALEFRSRLEGFEDQYSPWSRDAKRAYTNLPDGRYQLSFESRDGYGRIAQAPPLAISVPAPWFRTPLARAGYALGLLLALLAAAHLGARRRQQRMAVRQRELEEEVARRTAEIAAQAAQLREQALRLADMDRLKTDFFVNIGHEFRTPLTLVMGPLDDVLRDPRTRLGERTREQLELALRNSRRVLDLIVELLDVNRMEHGQLPLKRERCEFGAWLRSQLAEQQALVDRHGHQLQLQLPAGELFCEIDSLQLGRALANLVSNAAKYMPRGGRIDVSLERAGEDLVVAVRDQGCGIPAHELPHIFDRFHRASERGVEGFGVGLALAREIVDRHGGRIEAESVEGQGTTLRVFLPLAAAGATAAIAALPVEPPVAALPVDAAGDAAADARERPRVLVADDHPEMRERLVQLLESRFEVCAAEDGPGALQLARQQLPDVIVSDVMMPGFDGVELTRRLRAHDETSAIGILLLTAKAGAEHAVHGLRAGANDYLAKPFDAAELLARVGAILAHARRLQMRLAREAPPAPLPVRESGDARWLQRLHAHIDARMHDSAFDVEALAAAMHMDRSSLFRHLKQHTAQAPAELLRERRLLRAQALLREGAGSVTEIAFAVGFDSLSGFTRAFRGQFGQPPSQLLPAARASA